MVRTAAMSAGSTSSAAAHGVSSAGTERVSEGRTDGGAGPGQGRQGNRGCGQRRGWRARKARFPGGAPPARGKVLVPWSCRALTRGVYNACEVAVARHWGEEGLGALERLPRLLRLGLGEEREAAGAVQSAHGVGGGPIGALGDEERALHKTKCLLCAAFEEGEGGEVVENATHVDVGVVCVATPGLRLAGAGCGLQKFSGQRQVPAPHGEDGRQVACIAGLQRAKSGQFQGGERRAKRRGVLLGARLRRRFGTAHLVRHARLDPVHDLARDVAGLRTEFGPW